MSKLPPPKLDNPSSFQAAAHCVGAGLPRDEVSPAYLNLGPERVLRPLAKRSYSTTLTVAAKFMQPSVGM